MTREEHLSWAKERALNYLPAAPADAVGSFLSDMEKHSETAKAIQEFHLLAVAAMMSKNQDQARSLIEGVH
ncbi:hypothetical protein ACQU0X_25780 [Pseudovibrio ascidiaceicola]|uniref:hypothetical protein n=1 Tax=Pseudovibrio ascidiaceicola TaxID=285279 RepID=UPI003D35DDC9